MPRYLSGCAIVLALAACGAGRAASSSASPSASAGSRCGPAHAHILAASGAARVYTVGGTVYGCANRTGKRFRLGNAAVCLNAARIGPVSVAGERAAFGSERCGVDTGSAQLIVERLTDGRQLVDDPAMSMPLGVESYQTVVSVVLAADGDVAWIASGGSIIVHRHNVEVHKRDRTGEQLLDSGPTIIPGSLRLRGSKLSWKHARATHSASLG